MSILALTCPARHRSQHRLGMFTIGVFMAALLLLPRASYAEAARVAETRLALQSAIRQNRNQAKPPLLAREQFLRRSDIADVQLAPDGSALLYRQRGAQQTDLLLKDLATGKQTRVLADVQQTEVYWSGDSQRIWLADPRGLAVYERDTHSARRIVKWDETRKQRFLAVDANAADYALISEKVDHGGAWQYRYLRVDARGQTQLLLATTKPLRDVLLTKQGQLAFTATYEGAQFDTVIRRHDGGNAHELLRCRGIERCTLAGYSDKRGELWLLSHHGEDRLALQRWQMRDNQWQTIHRDPDAMTDAAALLWQAGSEDWLAIAYHPDRRHWYGNGARVQAQLTHLNQRLPDANLQLTTTADGQRWLVQARQSNWQRDRYYLYQPERDSLQPLFEQDADSEALIPPEQLAEAVPISYPARDGMLIHGYVYLPRGVDLTKAPLIANIHGGPFNRSRDNYDGINQLLVNRGYAVFTPNFRASTGYGQRYLLAAEADFGNGKVLGDIIDGLDFLLAQGIGDRNKQAVIGHSFGGYASLLAVSHYPARFRFAVAGAGPTELSWSMNWIAENGGSALPEDGPPAELFLSYHGMHLTDTAWQQKIHRESPLAQLPQLQTPLYLWAGGKDDRVPLKTIGHYAGEAKRLGKSLTLVVDPESGHNPGAPLNFEVIVYLIEAAASQHFGGTLTPPSAALQRFLDKNMRLKGELMK